MEESWASGLGNLRNYSVDLGKYKVSLKVLPSYETIRFNGYAFYVIVLRVSGGNKVVNVSLMVSGLPAQMNFNFGQVKYLSRESATVDLLIDPNDVTGFYPFNVTVFISESEKASSMVYLNVTSTRKDFSITLNRYRAKVVPNGNILLSTLLKPIRGYNRSVTLGTEGLPSSFKVVFTPRTINPPYLVQVNLSIPSDVNPQVLVFAVNGKGDEGFSHSSIFYLEILKPGSIDFALEIDPSQRNVLQGEKAFFKVKVVNLTHERDPVFLFIKGIPEDSLYGFGEDEFEPPGETILVIKSGNLTGKFNFTVYAVGGGVKRTVKAVLSVEEKKCFIATATFGSEMSGEVKRLRDFRNQFILKSYSGRQFYRVFNHVYYSFSPLIACFIEANPEVKIIVKTMLYPLIETLMISKEASNPIFAFNRELGVLTAGFLASFTLGLTYLGLPLSLFCAGVRKTFFMVNKYMKAIFLSLILLIALSTLNVAIVKSDPVSMFSTSMFVLSSFILGGFSLVFLVEKYLVKASNRLMKVEKQR